MKKIEFIQFIIIIQTCLISCSKDLTSSAIREGKYKCNGEYFSYCKSCNPQNTNYLYKDTISISFKGDSLSIDNGATLTRFNNDSFVYDRGPSYPGIYYSVNFLNNDSFYYRYLQSVQAFTVSKNSYCKKIY